MVATYRATSLLAVGCVLGECPLKHTSGDLVWVDIVSQVVYRWDRKGHPRTVRFDEPVSAVAETATGSLVAACASGLVHVADNGTRDLLVPLPNASSELRTNDGKADPFNRFVVGTMARPKPRQAAGSLWSFGAGRPLELLSGVTISNGLAWSADGATMYFIDTPTRRIDAFDYDTRSGALSQRRTIVEVGAGLGDPDGMCVDIDGGLWVALWGGAAVHRYVGGELAAVVEVPTPFVTCPAFAGEHGDELVITTASEPFGSSAPAGAGDLYVARVAAVGSSPFVIDLTRFELR